MDTARKVRITHPGRVQRAFAHEGTGTMRPAASKAPQAAVERTCRREVIKTAPELELQVILNRGSSAAIDRAQ